MNEYKRITELYFKSIKGFNEFESIPRDFGSGDLLYSSEIHTLQAIGNNENINLTELAIILDISKSGTSKFVKKLLDKDLITKSKNSGNKKEVVFNLTEKGKKAYFGHEVFSKKTFTPIHKILSSLSKNEMDILESFLYDLNSEVEKLNNK